MVGYDILFASSDVTNQDGRFLPQQILGYWHLPNSSIEQALNTTAQMLRQRIDGHEELPKQIFITLFSS